MKGGCMKKLNNRGQGMTEYIVILGILVAAAVFLYPQIRTALTTKVTSVTTAITQ